MILKKLFASYDYGNYPPSAGVLATLFSGIKTLSGVQVNDRTAMLCSAVWAASRLYAASAAMLPMNIYQRLPGGKNRKVDPDFYAQRILRKPNPRANRFLFDAVGTIHQINSGNGLAEIVRNGAGEPVELWRIHPSRARPPRYLEDGRMVYDVSDNLGPRQIADENMMHLPNIISDEGVWGLGVIAYARESIGTAIAHNRKGAADLGNRGVVPLAATHPGKLSSEARKNFREEWNEIHSGADNAGKLAVLQEGMKLEKLGLSNEDLEYIAMGHFGVEDLARWYSLPPHMIGHLEKATFDNIDQQSIEYVVYSLAPILAIREEEIGRKILLPRDQDNYYAKADFDELLKGDPEKRANSLSKQFQNGALKLDEWRAVEGRNPLEDDLGQRTFVPRNLIPLEQAIAGPPQKAPPPQKQAQPSPPPAAPQDPGKAEAVRTSGREFHRHLVAVMAQTYRRLNRKEAAAVRRATRQPGGFLNWLDNFYPRHETHLTEALEVAFALKVALSPTDVAVPHDLARAVAHSRCMLSREHLLQLSGTCTGPDLAGVLEPFCHYLETEAPGLWAAEDAALPERSPS